MGLKTNTFLDTFIYKLGVSRVNGARVLYYSRNVEFPKIKNKSWGTGTERQDPEVSVQTHEETLVCKCYRSQKTTSQVSKKGKPGESEKRPTEDQLPKEEKPEAEKR